MLCSFVGIWIRILVDSGLLPKTAKNIEYRIHFFYSIIKAKNNLVDGKFPILK